MAKIIDITGPLYQGMWSYNVLGVMPPLPECRVEKVTTQAGAGFESFGFGLCSVQGTYLETNAHLIEGGPTLREYECSDFIRPAVVCHVPRKEAGQLITRSELEANCPTVQEGDALLIECGWGQQWRSPSFVTETPGFHWECGDWLREQPMSILGVDVPRIQIEASTADSEQDVGNMLLPLFLKGILLLAPLVNLDTIRAERGELIALPLPAEGVSGAPCRAIFREGQG